MPKSRLCLYFCSTLPQHAKVKPQRIPQTDEGGKGQRERKEKGRQRLCLIGLPARVLHLPLSMRGRGRRWAGNRAKNDELKSLQTAATLRFGCRLPRCMPQNQLKQWQACLLYFLPPSASLNVLFLPPFLPLSASQKLSKAVKVAFGLRQLNWVTA